MGRNFSFNEIPNELFPFNYDHFNNSPIKLISVASNLETGEADYHQFEDAEADLDYLIASASMPLVSQIVEVDGKLLLDGGTCDSVPLGYSLMTDTPKHIVVLTQDANYVKGSNKLMALMMQRYHRYPYYLERLQNRHIDYNRVYRALPRLHEQGSIFLIRPPEPVTVSAMEKNPEKLFALWEQGYQCAAHQWEELQAYLAAPEVPVIPTQA